ncbi:MAG: hypothetical protein IKA90_02620, partial [Clostridia bacterium]|nr:hypothetical protein [Clostridia bacterium]
MGKILLNVMYAGDYLKEENNVGHEVINMFRTDDGANYIYVNPYGLLADKHYKDIETVLLTRRINANKWEILAKATDLEDVLIPNDIINSVENKAKLDTLSKDTKKVYNFTFCSDIFERTGKDAVEETDDLRLKKEMQKLVHENQVEYIKENNVKYGGKYINDILNKNQNNDYATYVTFRADAFHLPNKPIYITADDTYGKEREKVTEADIVFHLPGVFFAKQSFKMYFPMEKPTGKKAWEQYEKKYEAYKNAYEILKGIIDND